MRRRERASDRSGRGFGSHGGRAGPAPVRASSTSPTPSLERGREEGRQLELDAAVAARARRCLIFPPAPSRSSSPTSRARRGCCTSSARTTMQPRSRTIAVPIRDACARHGGVEVDTQGDAFFFAFPTAPGALAAARDAAGRARTRADPGAGRRPHRDAPRDGRGLRRRRRPPGGADRGGGPRRPDSRVDGDDVPVGSDGSDSPRRPRGAPLQGPRGARARFQLGDGEFPPFRSLCPNEPPGAGDAVSRAGAGAGRGRELLRRRRAPPSDVERAGRNREDQARAAGGGGGGRSPTPTASGGYRWRPARRELVVSSLAQALQVEEQPGRELAEISRPSDSSASARCCCSTTSSTCCRRSPRRSRAFGTSPARSSW